MAVITALGMADIAADRFSLILILPLLSPLVLSPIIASLLCYHLFYKPLLLWVNPLQ
jgi:hypothetical protein